MYEKELLPNAISIGVSYNEFWEINPKILNIIFEGHKLKLKEQDMMNWYLGQYCMSAFLTALDFAFNGKKAKDNYPKTPVMSSPDFGLTEEEKQERKLAKMIEQEMAWIKKDKTLGILPSSN